MNLLHNDVIYLLDILAASY